MFEMFNIYNGLSGMMRDVVIRLISLMGGNCNDIKVRMIIGMCSEHFFWKTHLYFVNIRIKNCVMHNTLRHNSSGRKYQITHTLAGDICAFGEDDEYQTVFLEKSVTEGIFQWKVQFYHGTERTTQFYFGLALTSCLSDCELHWLGSSPGSYSFGFCYQYKKRIWSKLFGEFKTRGFEFKMEVPDKSLIVLEVNADSRILSMFVDGKKVPVSIASIPIPFNLGVSGEYKPSFTSLSFCRLPSATPTPPDCTCKLAEAFLPKKIVFKYSDLF